MENSLCSFFNSSPYFSNLILAHLVLFNLSVSLRNLSIDFLHSFVTISIVIVAVIVPDLSLYQCLLIALLDNPGILIDNIPFPVSLILLELFLVELLLFEFWVVGELPEYLLIFWRISLSTLYILSIFSIIIFNRELVGDFGVFGLFFWGLGAWGRFLEILTSDQFQIILPTLLS